VELDSEPGAAPFAFPAAVLDAGPDRERMIDEALAMTVARCRDLIDAADSGWPMVPFETGRKDPVSARSAVFVVSIKGVVSKHERER